MPISMSRKKLAEAVLFQLYCGLVLALALLLSGCFENQSDSPSVTSVNPTTSPVSSPGQSASLDPTPTPTPSPQVNNGPLPTGANTNVSITFWNWADGRTTYVIVDQSQATPQLSPSYDLGIDAEPGKFAAAYGADGNYHFCYLAPGDEQVYCGVLTSGLPTSSLVATGKASSFQLIAYMSNLYLLVVMDDQQVYYDTYTPGTNGQSGQWGSTYTLAVSGGGPVLGQPTVSAYGQSMALVVQEADGLYYSTCSSGKQGTSCGAYKALTMPSLQGQFSALAGADGGVQLYVWGSDGLLHGSSLSVNGKSSSLSLSSTGPINGTPTVGEIGGLPAVLTLTPTNQANISVNGVSSPLPEAPGGLAAVPKLGYSGAGYYVVAPLVGGGAAFSFLGSDDKTWGNWQTTADPNTQVLLATTGPYCKGGYPGYQPWLPPNLQYGTDGSLLGSTGNIASLLTLLQYTEAEIQAVIAQVDNLILSITQEISSLMSALASAMDGAF